jgi:hypothetical protein
VAKLFTVKKEVAMTEKRARLTKRFLLLNKFIVTFGFALLKHKNSIKKGGLSHLLKIRVF